MRKYKIKKIDHSVYEDSDEYPKDLVIQENWRSGRVGDWVLADDGCVMQVLREGTVKQGKKETRYIGTCTGTFICKPNTIFDSTKRKNIYSFGGDSDHKESLNNRKNPTLKEVMFSKFVAHGMKPVDAYIKAFDTMNREYATERSAMLIKQERIIMAVKEELDGVFTKLGINLEYLIGKAKDELEMSDRASDRLKALSMLWEAADVVPKQTKVTALTGAVFQGFDKDSLESAQRPVKSLSASK